MDGGGFNKNQQNNQMNRGTGVVSVNAHMVRKSTQNNSNAEVSLPGISTQKLGQVVKYCGTFLAFETLETHSTCTIDDSTTDEPLRVIVQQSTMPGFNENTATLLKDRIVQVIGLCHDNLDYTRVIHALNISEVQSTEEWLCHQLEITYQLKKWKEDGDSNKENSSGAMNFIQNNNSGNDANKINQKIQTVIADLGASETWGCKRDQIYKQLGDFSKTKVDTGIQYLIDEGMIYNTLDDDTFKSSDQ